ADQGDPGVRGIVGKPVRKPLPPTPSPKRRGGAEGSFSPSPSRGGGWGEGFFPSLGLVLLLSAPARADSQRLLLLAEREPVVVELQVSIDGKPLASAWERYLERLFADLDRDSDGSLSRAEAARAPGLDFVTTFLQGALNLEAAASAAPFDELDTDR